MPAFRSILLTGQKASDLIIHLQLNNLLYIWMLLIKPTPWPSQYPQPFLLIILDSKKIPKIFKVKRMKQVYEYIVRLAPNTI